MLANQNRRIARPTQSLGGLSVIFLVAVSRTRWESPPFIASERGFVQLTFSESGVFNPGLLHETSVLP